MLQVLLRTFGLWYLGTPKDYSSRPSRLLETILLNYKVLGGLSYGPPWAHYLGGYETDYSVGLWDYSACATQHLMAWGARTTAEEYSDRKLYMSHTV
jgi:hypothetical protein